ncbi:MAG: hypothetical protein JSS49_14775 [Planctomycetes bacterium]|nr:hypothetical protein [Planctomycetota bacterium]
MKISTLRMIAVIGLVLVGATAPVTAKVTTIATPGGGQPMVAKTDPKGTIHLVFDTRNGPQYVSSIDNGRTLSQPIDLVDPASRKPGLEFITWDMVVSSDGTVHVALGTNAWKLKLPKDEWGFMYTRLLPGAREFEPVKNVNHKPSEGFSLAVGDDGEVAAVWMADKLFFNLSKDHGATFGPIVEIDSALNPCNCCTTSAVFAADGRLAILYREETNNDRDMYLGLVDLKTNQATKTRVSSTGWKIDSCPMTYYSVARTETGFVAAWPTKGQIFFAKLSADGSPITPKEIKTPGACGMRTGVLALPTTDGKTLVAWKKDKQLGWQVYDGRGRPMGAPGGAPSDGSGVAAVVVKNGDVVLFK